MAQHVLSAKQIGVASDVNWRSLFCYLNAFLTCWFEALLKRKYRGGRQSTLADANREAFLAWLRN